MSFINLFRSLWCSLEMQQSNFLKSIWGSFCYKLQPILSLNANLIRDGNISVDLVQWALPYFVDLNIKSFKGNK